MPKLSKPPAPSAISRRASLRARAGIAAGQRDGKGLRFGKMALEAVGLEGEASDDADGRAVDAGHMPQVTWCELLRIRLR